eukprot:754689_1
MSSNRQSAGSSSSNQDRDVAMPEGNSAALSAVEEDAENARRRTSILSHDCRENIVAASARWTGNSPGQKVAISIYTEFEKKSSDPNLDFTQMFGKFAQTVLDSAKTLHEPDDLKNAVDGLLAVSGDKKCRDAMFTAALVQVGKHLTRGEVNSWSIAVIFLRDIMEKCDIDEFAQALSNIKVDYDGV